MLNIGTSTAIRWIERWPTTGSVAAKPGTGHSRSPLKQHEQWLLDLVAEEPNLTLYEIRARLPSEKKMRAGISSIWRFYERHSITFEKTLHAAEQDRPDVAAARAELKAEQPALDAPRLVFIDETVVTTKPGRFRPPDRLLAMLGTRLNSGHHRWPERQIERMIQRLFRNATR